MTKERAKGIGGNLICVVILASMIYENPWLLLGVAFLALWA